MREELLRGLCEAGRLGSADPNPNLNPNPNPNPNPDQVGRRAAARGAVRGVQVRGRDDGPLRLGHAARARTQGAQPAALTLTRTRTRTLTLTLTLTLTPTPTPTLTLTLTLTLTRCARAKLSLGAAAMKREAWEEARPVVTPPSRMHRSEEPARPVFTTPL